MVGLWGYRSIFLILLAAIAGCVLMLSLVRVVRQEGAIELAPA